MRKLMVALAALTAAAIAAKKKEANSVPVIEMVMGDPSAQKPISAVGKCTNRLNPHPNTTIQVATLTRSR